MALIGLSLIFGAVVWVLVRPPIWLAPYLLHWRGFLPLLDRPPDRPRDETPTIRLQEEDEADTPDIQLQREREDASLPAKKPGKTAEDRAAMPPPPIIRPAQAAKDRAAMPPPPTIRRSNQEPQKEEEQTTPKASATEPASAVPSFSLDGHVASNAPSPAPPSFPAANSQQRAGGSRPPSFPAINSQQRASGASSGTRLPSLFPGPNSQQRTLPVPNRTLPIPNRGPPGSSSLAPQASPSPSSSLAPPPTHTSKPQKPTRKVLLAPGHSPLDWAAISGPNADLRGVPASAPYLRVTPSMLKEKTGRKGKDAWTILSGKVYNITPYLPYHPGGEPELLRCAGRDGTKLFGEVHPWVNYENMLQACLVGIFVEEHEKNSQMEEMD